MNTFGTLLRDARLRSKDPNTNRPLSQENLTQRLNSAAGFGYSRVSLRNWEADVNKIHHNDRPLLVGLICVLHEFGGLTTQESANELLVAGDYRRLDEHEMREVNPQWDVPPVLRPFFLTAAEQSAALPANPHPLIDNADTIADISSTFTAETYSRLTVLIGVAGSGKSVFSVAIAHQMIKSGQFDRVLRIILPPDVENPVTALIKTLDREIIGHDASRSIDVQRAFVQAHLRQHAYFVVVDGLEEVTETLCSHVASWTGPSRFLLTGRTRPSLIQAHVREIPIWEIETARTFVHQLITQQNYQHNMPDETLLATLCEIVGNNPRALQMIPALLRRRRPQQLVSALKQSVGLQHLQTEITTAAWQLLDRDAKYLLTALSFVTQTGISDDVLQTVHQTKHFWTMLEQLERHALVMMHTEQVGWYRTHQLAADYVLIQPDAPTAEVGGAMLSYWQRRFEHINPSAWHLLTHEQPNIFYAVTRCLNLKDETLYAQLAEFLPILYRFSKSWGFLDDLLSILIHIPARPFSAVAMCQLTILLGTTQRNLYQPALAITTLQRGHQLASSLDDLQQQARALWELASAYKALQQYADATAHLEQALQIYQQLDDQRRIGLSEHLQGLLAFAQGDAPQAEQLLEQATTKLDEADLVTPLRNYAGILQSQQKYEAAQAVYDRLHKLVQAYGTSHDQLTLAEAEAALAMRQGAYERSDSLFKTIKIDQVPDIRFQATAWWNWGLLAQKQKRFADARTRIQKSADLYRDLNDMEKVQRATRELAQIDAMPRE